MSDTPILPQRKRNPDGTFATQGVVKPHCSVDDRFWAKVQKSDNPDGCWLWNAAINPNGYAQFGIGYKKVYAHRWAYEQVHGPIPKGLQIDHLCRVRHCVNPAHLEIVTNRENFLRGGAPNAKLHHAGHCKHGHPFTKANTYIKKNGTRQCRACSAELHRKYRKQKAT